MKIFTLSSDKSDRKRNIVKPFLKIVAISSFTTSYSRFSEVNAGKVTLFQIKVSGRNNRETTPERCFIKVSTCPSFTR